MKISSNDKAPYQKFTDMVDWLGSHESVEVEEPKKPKQFYTTEMFQQIMECLEDPLHFIENYIWIEHPVKGSIPFRLGDHQKRMLDEYHTFGRIIAKTPRQSGMTTLFAAYAIWEACFTDKKRIQFILPSMAQAQHMMSLMTQMYDGLPEFLRPNLKYRNRTQLEFENKSIIGVGTSAHALRGSSLSSLVLMDFAFVKREIQDEIWQNSAPYFGSYRDTKLAIVSTPNGAMDTFHQLWNRNTGGQSTMLKPIHIEFKDLWPSRVRMESNLRLTYGKLAASRDMDCEFVEELK